MKLKTLLALAGVGLAVGLLLTKTEKGKQLRNQIADKADELGNRLSKLSRKAQNDLSGLVDDGMTTARNLKRNVNSQMS